MLSMTSGLAIEDACRATQVPYDDLISTIAAGGYPCLPGADPGSPRLFEEIDLVTLYVYGRLLAFGFGVLRAGEYACRVHAALRSNASVESVSIVLTPSGGKRVVVGCDQIAPPSAGLPEKIEFDIRAIRLSLNEPVESYAEG